MGRTKTIKVSQAEYDLLKLAREKLIEYGVHRLPDPLRTDVLKFLEGQELVLGKMVGVVSLVLSHMLTSKES